MTCHASVSLALLWLRASLTDALFMRVPIESPNQAEHDRPHRRSMYKRVADLQAGDIELHKEAYRRIGQLLDLATSMPHSKHILHFVMSHPEAPVLPPGGCMYLPSDTAWASFYEHLEHPFPALFVEMVANSYYPSCNDTSLSGLKLPSSCGAEAMRGSRGCFKVTSLGSAAGIEVFETAGHVGLPDKWSYHIEHATAPRSRVPQTGAVSKCGMSGELPQVPQAARLVIPTRYVVCRMSDDDDSVTEQHVREQNRWANEALSGLSPWARTDFDGDERPASADMQISFELSDISIVTDSQCAKHGFTKPWLLHKYNQNASQHFTFVIIANDQSGVMGQSLLPHQLSEEDSPEHMVVVSTEGFRGHAGRNRGDMRYDEGDALVHEAGHGLGLYHTFEGSCANRGANGGRGDFIEDTSDEAMPHYECALTRSCGKADPVHNFMAYSPDSCKVGFTEGQKRRAWCELEHHRAALYQRSLRK